MSDDKQDRSETFSTEEEKQAQHLAEELDSLLQDGAIPPVLGAEERELLLLSSLVHANFRDAKLTSEKQNSILDAAMTQAMSLDTVSLQADSNSENVVD